jgi:hypothetical protein
MKIALFDSAWEYDVDTPYNNPLGGTQSSICYFLEEMKLRNHEMYLFNKRDMTKLINGVVHVPAVEYLSYIKNNNIAFDLIIVSCLVNDLFQIKNSLNNPKIMYCLWTGHDIDQLSSKLLNDVKAKDMVDIFIFVSEWQRNRYIQQYSINYNKTIIF